MRWSDLASALRARLLLVLAGVGLAVLCAAAVPAANAATPATSYGLVNLFGNGNGVADGSSDVAVSPSTGNVFIAELNMGTVGVFDADGTPLADFDNYSPTGFSSHDLAVDPATDAVYVADSVFAAGVARFLSDGAPTPTYTYDASFTPTGFVKPAGLAVDPVSHDLYVADSGANRVVRLDATDGHQVASLDGTNTGRRFGKARTVTVDASGTLYVVDDIGGRVERFSSAGASLGALPLPGGSQPSAIAVNAQTSAVAVVVKLGTKSYILGFSSAGTRTFATQLTAPINPANAPISGLAWNGALNRLYVSRGNGTTWVLDPVLAPGLDAPTVTPGRNTAHVSAEVAPGGEDTTARFEYCPATEACDNYIKSDPNEAANPWKRGPEHTGLTSTTTIEDDLPLSSNATWKVRVSADNNVSFTDNESSVTTVQSPLVSPGVTTGAAGSVTESQAELNGMIDTIGALTTYHFEYGLTTSYGSRIPVSSEAAAGDSRTPRAVSRIISGLQSGTTYHYRLVAQNAAGETFGSDRTFTTAGPDEIAPHRAYEQVTPVDKGGAQVLSDFHVQAADDGSAIAVTSVAASRSAESAHILQNYLSRRGSSDWLAWQPIDAPQNAVAGLLESSTMAMSSDFHHALVASNRVLAPGGIAGGGNLYVKDMDTGGYTFVGGAAGESAYKRLVGIQANERIFLGGAPDFSWIVFYAEPALVPTVSTSAIYRWTRSTGQLTVESLLPGNVPSPFDAQSSGLPLPSVSSDGRVIGLGFALPGQGIPVGVYRRANGDTTAISVSRRASDPPDAQPAAFDGMTSDGRFMFFHGPVQLTDDAPAPDGTFFNAYRYDARSDALIYLGPTTVANSKVIVFGDDGQTAYLDTRDGMTVWRNGQIRPVSSDQPLFHNDATGVSTDGRYFAWSSGDRGTANLYDANENRAVCVSCPADGSSGAGAQMAAGARSIGNSAPRVVLDDGTVFFDSPKRLVTSDHNGTRDVYAYKNGRLTLISPGDAAVDAFFVAASADGRSVFFQTDEGLVSRDDDDESDVYVARVGGGFASQNPPPPPAPCVRAECGEVGSGPVSSPAAPSSSTGASDNSPKRTNQARVKISLSRVSIGSKTVKITFRASERGRVRVTGSRVRTTIRNATKAGTYSVSVPLSKKARSLRHAHKRFKVSLRVSLSGGWGTSTAKYSRTLGKKSSHAGGKKSSHAGGKSSRTPAKTSK
jgi:DNA-binding beta-propeller fold protein YncE